MASTNVQDNNGGNNGGDNVNNANVAHSNAGTLIVVDMQESISLWCICIL